jgi:hypothetical protein
MQLSWQAETECAIRAGDLGEVQRLLGLPYADGRALHAVHVAAETGSIGVARWLLEHAGYRVAARDRQGYTPLLVAARENHWDLVRWFLQVGGARLDDRSPAGDTVFMYAVRDMQVSTVQWILRRFAGAVHTGGDSAAVWNTFRVALTEFGVADMPSAARIADTYSVLRCYSPPSSAAAILQVLREATQIPLPANHRGLLLQTECAHAQPNLIRYRAYRLDLLGRERDGGSDCARLLMPDLQDIVLGYLCDHASLLKYLPDADLRAVAIIAEAHEAEQRTRWGRIVRRKLD